jgi:hypothetical protein
MKPQLILLVLITLFIPGRHYVLTRFLRPALADLCIRIREMELSSQWNALRHVKT